MDTRRDVRREEGPRAPGEPSIKEAVRSGRSTGNGEVMRDRVTGVGTRRRRPVGVSKDADSGEIEQELRRTRARMSATLDDIEDRLAPARLKRDLKNAVQDTIDDVRDEFNPMKMARQTGDTMIETIRDHPLAAAAAGASISYLVVKGMQGDGRPPYPYSERERPRSRSWQDQTSERTDDFREGVQEARQRADDARREVRHQTQEVQHRAREAQHQAREVSQEAAQRSRHAAETAQRQVRATGSRIEDFVFENPFAAGAVALGVGALIGGLFPSTRIEDRYMGPMRDEAIDRAKDAADDTMERGKEAGRRVADEAKEAARDVAETAKHEAQGVGDTARESAQDKAQSGGTESDRPASRGTESATERRSPGGSSTGSTESDKRTL